MILFMLKTNYIFFYFSKRGSLLERCQQYVDGAITSVGHICVNMLSLDHLETQASTWTHERTDKILVF